MTLFPIKQKLTDRLGPTKQTQFYEELLNFVTRGFNLIIISEEASCFFFFFLVPSRGICEVTLLTWDTEYTKCSVHKRLELWENCSSHENMDIAPHCIQLRSKGLLM